MPATAPVGAGHARDSWRSATRASRHRPSLRPEALELLL